MLRLLKRFVPLLFSGLCLLSPSARADGAAPAAPPAALPAASEEVDARVLWWLEGRPWSCSDAVGPVARRVELACDASGRKCGVASDRARASRLAALVCGPDGGWTRLDAEDGEGHALWSLALSGDEEAKERKAAMWIARAEVDGPPSAPSQETVAAVPPSPPAAPPAEAPPPLQVIVVPAKDSAQSPSPGEAENAGKVAFDVSLGTAVPISELEPGSGSSLVPLVGARFAAAFRVSRSLFVGGAGDGMTAPSSSPTTYAHLGGLLALGAPFTHDWIGASAEGGVSLWIYPDGAPTVTHAGIGGTTRTSTTWSPGSSYAVAPRPYGKANLVLQWPRETGVRPYLAASFIVSDDGMNRSAMASFGLAWNER
jgi:hypothetical protein